VESGILGRMKGCYVLFLIDDGLDCMEGIGEVFYLAIGGIGGVFEVGS
jgi:hypothetical protein